MKASEILKKQHREVEGLFKSALASKNASERMEFVEKLSALIQMHSALEEEIFYPAFRDGVDTKKGRDLVLESYEEHHVVSGLLEELSEADPEAESFPAKLTVLKEIIEHHVEEEEQEMFPTAEKKLGKERLEELASEMQAELDDLMAGAARGDDGEAAQPRARKPGRRAGGEPAARPARATR